MTDTNNYLQKMKQEAVEANRQCQQVGWLGACQLGRTEQWESYVRNCTPAIIAAMCDVCEAAYEAESVYYLDKTSAYKGTIGAGRMRNLQQALQTLQETIRKETL